MVPFCYDFNKNDIISQKRLLLKYVGIVIGLVLGLYGMWRIDFVLYEGMNYFGKYVFFALFNLFVLWLFYFFYKRFDGWLKISMPVLLGVVILLVSLKLV